MAAGIARPHTFTTYGQVPLDKTAEPKDQKRWRRSLLGLARTPCLSFFPFLLFSSGMLLMCFLCRNDESRPLPALESISVLQDGRVLLVCLCGHRHWCHSLLYVASRADVSADGVPRYILYIHILQYGVDTTVEQHAKCGRKGRVITTGTFSSFQ